MKHTVDSITKELHDFADFIQKDLELTLDLTLIIMLNYNNRCSFFSSNGNGGEVCIAMWWINLLDELNERIIDQFIQNAKFIIAHEMKHAHQYQTGRMQPGGMEYFFWQGKKYSKRQGDTSEEHHSLPWEVDANNYADSISSSLGFERFDVDTYFELHSHFSDKYDKDGTLIEKRCA